MRRSMPMRSAPTRRPSHRPLTTNPPSMFVGHLALAFAAKRRAPAASLGWLMAGVTALDLVWPVFVLAGIERVRIVPGATAFTPLAFDSYPWSHSLVMAV